MSEPLSYTRTAKGLHWLIFGLIACAVSMGWIMTDMAFSPQKLKLFNYHKWVGVTILSLVLVRIVWRLTHKAPPMVLMPRWQSIAAHSLHGVLYLLMLAIPLSGWAYSNAAGYPIVYLGKIPLPNLLEKNMELSKQLAELHGTLATVLVVLVAAHVLAALKHHFINHDRTLRRMLPALLLGALMMGSAPLDAAETKPPAAKPAATAKPPAANAKPGATPAAPVGAAIDAAKSHITAVFKQEGVAVDSVFKQFSGQIAYDPAQPAAAIANLEVRSGSWDIGDPAYNAEVQKKEWLDAAGFPVATFRSNAVKVKAPGQLDITGTLNLKGKAVVLTVPVTVKSAGAVHAFEGTLTLSRKAFVIGSPIWDDLVDDSVTVKFRLVNVAK